MVTRTEAFPSRFFKAADIPGDGLAAKIGKIEKEKVGPDQELKWVLYFKGQDKQLILNGTNWDLIAAALREEDSDNWIGKTIELFPAQTQFGKKMVDCIRVRRHRPAAQAAPTQPAKAAPVVVEEGPTPWDDEVPYVGEEPEEAA
jgi:hypothetical protein